MIFSRKTIAALARALATSWKDHSHLDVLFYEYGLEHEDEKGNVLTRYLALLRAMNEWVTPKEAAQKNLFEITEQFLKKLTTYELESDEELIALQKALRLEGLECRDRQLLPTTPEPVALGSEITSLEKDLKDLELNVSVEHYRQAVDNFVDGNEEACNGQIRSYLEDLFIGICERMCKQTVKDAQAALQHLRSGDYLDEAEWHTFRSFWNSIQDKGPHRGLSDDEESLYRLHVATAMSRYLIHKAKSI